MPVLRVTEQTVSTTNRMKLSVVSINMGEQTTQPWFRKAVINLVIVVALMFGGSMVIRKAHNRLWEGMLDGPFVGRSFTNTPAGDPVGTLDAGQIGVLESYQTANQPAPVLLLRDSSGAVRWSRELLPVKENSERRSQEVGLRNLVLNKVERRDDGLIVWIDCHWDNGGNESGQIHLNLDGEFSYFMLSW